MPQQNRLRFMCCVAHKEGAYEDDSVRSDAEEGMLAEALAHWDKRVLRTLRRWSFVPRDSYR